MSPELPRPNQGGPASAVIIIPLDAVPSASPRSPPATSHPPLVEAWEWPALPPRSPKPPSTPPLPLSCANANDCRGRTCTEWFIFGGGVTCSTLLSQFECQHA